MSFVKWERVCFNNTMVCRTKVAGGWLVWSNDRQTGGVTFLADPKNKWGKVTREFEEHR